MGRDNHVSGRLVAGLGGAALAVSVFMTWYSLNLVEIVRSATSGLPAQLSGAVSAAVAPAGDLTLNWSAWHGLHTIRFVLLIVGLAVLARSAMPATTSGTHESLLVLVGGLLATVLVAYRIESPPGTLDISLGPFSLPSPAGVAAALSRLLHVEAGAWLALIGGVLAMLGGVLQMASARTAAAEASTEYPAAPASNAAAAARVLPW
jgi:uncharacterized membrane protein